MGKREGTLENLVSIINANAQIDSNFWRNKKVLVTGHTGFKGGWLTIWLNTLGCNVSGIGLPPQTQQSLFSQARISEICDSFIVDIRNVDKLNKTISAINPDIVFHLAAQSLVRESYDDPLNTISTNVMGTANILDCIRGSDSIKTAVMVTTDKVYRDQNTSIPYTEESILGGHDPYSASKSASELIIDSYRNAFLKDRDIHIGSARAGNVIGGGDWAKDRIIPDAIKAWSTNSTLHIRNPNSIRPWQHVLEPLFGYIIFAQALDQDISLAQPYNFGPNFKDTETVQNIISIAKSLWGNAKVDFRNVSSPLKETFFLSLSSEKSQRELKITPKWDINQAIEYTINWYKKQLNGDDALDLCNHDIKLFEAK